MLACTVVWPTLPNENFRIEWYLHKFSIFTKISLPSFNATEYSANLEWTDYNSWRNKATPNINENIQAYHTHLESVVCALYIYHIYKYKCNNISICIPPQHSQCDQTYLFNKLNIHSTKLNYLTNWKYTPQVQHANIGTQDDENNTELFGVKKVENST